MTLTIHKLSTRCRSPRGLESAAALVDDVAHGRLASELGACLGPSLSRLPAVVRLQRLRVRVKVESRSLDATSLADAWARSFSVALHEALARPLDDGAVPRRTYDSVAAYRAAMIHHVATSGAEVNWEYPELAAWTGQSPSEAALGLLLLDVTLIAGIAARLERNGGLERLLALWDEVSLERLMRAVAQSEAESPALSLEELVELGNAAAAAGGLRGEWTFAGRRQAARLWVRLHPRFPLRCVWHGLRLLQRLLEKPVRPIVEHARHLSEGIPFPPWCEAIVQRLSAAQSTPSTAAPGALALASTLDRLRPLLPSAAQPGAATPARWIRSDRCGVLLLLSTVERLDLRRFIDQPEFKRFGGARAFSFLLAAIGMRLSSHWTVGEPVEGAVALFAGIIAEPDVRGMRQFFSEADVRALADFVSASTWDEALDRAGAEIARSFASRVRGFRRASRDAVVRQFVRTGGRVLVEDDRVLVVLESTPWAVALHLSAIDEPLPSVEWLDGRRVEYVLEGLS